MTSIDVSDKSIADLTGIEHFTALTYLACTGNQLTSLDVSGCTALTRLYCSSNQLTSLDVSGCTALTLLSCNSNQLTSLDVSKNTALWTLYCYSNQIKGNKMLALVNGLRGLPTDGTFCAIDTKNSSEQNVITKSQVAIATGNRWRVYDRNGGSNIEYAGSDDPIERESVDLGLPSGTLWASCNVGATNPEDYGDYFAWSSDDIAKANWGEKWRMPTKSEIEELFKYTICKSTTENGVNGHRFTAKNGSGNSIFIPLAGYYYNGSANGGKTGFFWSSSLNNYNQPGYVFIALGSDDPQWRWVSATSVGWYSVRPVSGGIAIDETNFPDATFRSFVAAASIDTDGDNCLTLAEATAVTTMSIGEMGITNLTGIEHFPALTTLECYDNQLTSLDVSKNTALTYLSCFDNQIKGEKMLALVNSLPTVTSGTFCAIDTWSGNEQNVITKPQVAIATGKGWRVVDANGGGDYAGIDDPTSIEINETNFPDENFRNWLLNQSYGKYDGVLTSDEIATVTKINVYDKGIANLKGIEYFTALTDLDCSGNQLTALDVSQNTALTRLRLYGNQIKGDEMQALVESLPTVTNGSLIVVRNSDGNSATKAQLDIARSKGWRVFKHDGNKYSTYIGLITISVSANPAEGGTVTGAGTYDGGTKIELYATPNNGYQFVGWTENGSKVYTNAVYSFTVDDDRTLVAEFEPCENEGIAINEQNFPDINFRWAIQAECGVQTGSSSALLSPIDKNGNGYLSDEEIAEVNKLYFTSMPSSYPPYVVGSGVGVKDLTGIEHFTELNLLWIRGIGYNRNLDISKNTKLTELDLTWCALPSLDLSKNTELKILNYDGLNDIYITSIDLSKNTKLKDLRWRSDYTTSLDLSKNTELNYLSLGCPLTTLDLSNQTKVYYCYLTARKLTKYAVKLADGRIGIDLGLESLDAARFVNLKKDGVGTDAVVSGKYLIIADNAANCPNSVTYQYDTKLPTKTMLMDVSITIDQKYLTAILLLDDDEGAEFDNSQRIAEQVGNVVDVAISGRNLLLNTDWNTLCLPFETTKTNSFVVKEFVGSSYTAATKTLTLNFADVTEMEAGKPYLVRTARMRYDSPDFATWFGNSVTISDAPASSIETDYVDFVGQYSTLNIAGEDKTLLFMGGDSKLYYPNDPMKIGAFRGYFRLKNGLTAGDLSSNAKTIVLDFGNGETTRIDASQLTVDGLGDDWYSIDGRKLNGEPTAKGIYIRNGKKVIIK